MRQAQAFPYRSKEWEEFHRHARNSIESLNGGVKDLGHEAIEEASRRRVRGFAAAQVFVTILLTNYNLRKIATFAQEQFRASLKPTTPAPVEKKIRRRDRDFRNPYTDDEAALRWRHCQDHPGRGGRTLGRPHPCDLPPPCPIGYKSTSPAWN
jgi:hypothetical protein